MTSLTGPDVQQVTWKTLIEVSDSKKFPDGITMKLNGTNGTGEYSVDDLVNIYVYIKDFLAMKGLNAELEVAANRLLDKSYLPGG